MAIFQIKKFDILGSARLRELEAVNILEYTLPPSGRICMMYRAFAKEKTKEDKKRL